MQMHGAALLHSCCAIISIIRVNVINMVNVINIYNDN